MSTDLYLSFWTLSLQDIHCPTDACVPCTTVISVWRNLESTLVENPALLQQYLCCHLNFGGSS